MHYDKWIQPAENIMLGDSAIKWYNLAKAEQPVPTEIFDLSVSFLENMAAVDDLGEMGFVILHRCGADFYFLLLSTWKNGNELWESVYAKTNDDHANFSQFPLNEPHHATFCVWELAAVWHEQKAWRRFLLSGKTETDRESYLNDQYLGVA